MTNTRATKTVRGLTALGIATAIGLCGIASAGSAQAASVLNGPIGLGTSATYGVLAGSALTNTGPTTVDGDLGVNPGSSITGFTGAPNGSNVGAVHDNDAPALQAQSDLTTAYNNAAGLTPTASGLAELNGMSLTPGVYSGGSLSLSDNGTLTLAGSDAASVWVFQAASSLTIGSATQIIITGGASACNVFWQVGSSASIGTSAHFQGTVMADQAVTAATGADVIGRLLARSAEVTLQSNTITVPANCVPGSPPITTVDLAITSTTLPTATAGTPYAFALTTTVPVSRFRIASGALPSGLVLDSTTGMISGIPLTHGVASFTVAAGSGGPTDVTAALTLSTAALRLAETGQNPLPALTLGAALLMGGLFLLAFRRRRSIQ